MNRCAAKSAYGIKGLIEVPELKEGDQNDFLTKLFGTVRANLQKEAGELDPKMNEYKEVMEAAKRVCADVNKPEDIPGAMEMLQNLPSVLTSEKEVRAMFKKKLESLGIVYDKSAKAYRYAE